MTDENVVTKKNGVDAYGLLIDYLCLDGEGKLVTQERAFLAQNMLCTYSRAKDNKRAAWEAQVYPTHEKAREALLAQVAFHGSAVMTDDPVVVELTATDISSINNGEAPPSRHAGVVAIEKKTGKVDDTKVYKLPDGVWDDIDED